DQTAWQMPQGGVDKAEEPKDAALRELWEETGVTADLVDLLASTDDWLNYDLPHDLVPNIWKGRFRGQKQKWFLFRFTGIDEQINIQTDHPEFSEWRWLPPGELVQNIVPFKRAVYEQLMDRFKEYL
ncbi:MAG: RNA pyrophosphohydrolase, partial [Pseudomonadota bacterium]